MSRSRSSPSPRSLLSARPSLTPTSARSRFLHLLCRARLRTSRELYREAAARAPRSITLKAVPYYAWGNRGDTDMSVWLPIR